ncbi:MAG: Uma2 family endonuclease [Dehalococcoidia bacterium]|nr:Uma2 family endonuclease [Dehalococcoidia bacterium]
MSTPAPPRLMTAEEFARLPDDPDGRQMELYDGEVIYMPPPGMPHGRTAGRIVAKLYPFIEEHQLGEAGVESGFALREGPDRVAAPDVWFAAAGLLNDDDGRTYPVASPTLAVEVVSASTPDRDSGSKALEYIAAGSQRVWLVRLRNRTVTVYRPGGDSHTYESDDTLTSEDAGFEVAGFELPVGQIFA